jgi:hypothetical protein
MTANPSNPFPFEPTKSASSKPHVPRKMQKYEPPFEGRSGRLETKSDLYVLLELQTERLEMPTVFLRRVPVEIAIDKGLVLPDPQFGHLNLSAVFVAISRNSDLVVHCIS